MGASVQPIQPSANPTNFQADYWEQLTHAGIAPDSATAIVQSHAGMSDADLWERLTQNGAAPAAATQLVHARASAAPPVGVGSPGLLDSFMNLISGNPAKQALELSDPSSGVRGMARSAVQGGTFGFGDEMGITDRGAEKAFKNAHSIADFLSKLAGGIVAPAAAVVAAPEALAGAGGAALLGGASGMLNGIGEGETAHDRAVGGLFGAALGAAGGRLGYDASTMFGAAGSKLLDRIKPIRAVARAASGLLDDPAATEATMDEMNQLAPGSASIASSTIARDGTDQSRFLHMARGTGADPAASQTGEANVVAQRAAIQSGKNALGTQMDALQTSDIPITPAVRDAINLVRPVLGSKTPDLPPPPPNMFGATPPAGLQTSAMSAFGANPVIQNPAATTMSLEDARDALSRLRYLSRQQEVLGVSANGVTKRDINVARTALQDLIYQHRPDFAPLDRQYAKLMDQEGATEDLLTNIQRSRGAHAGNDAFGIKSGSLGGSLPSNALSATKAFFDNVLAGGPKVSAKAVTDMILKPGGPEMVQNLLSKVPADGTPPITSAMRAGIFSALPPALHGLLFDQPDD